MNHVVPGSKRVRVARGKRLLVGASCLTGALETIADSGTGLEDARRIARLALHALDVIAEEGYIPSLRDMLIWYKTAHVAAEKVTDYVQ